MFRSVYGTLCLSIDVYESLWGFIRIYGMTSMWLTMGIMEFHRCLWEFVRIYGGLREYMEAYESLDKYE